MLQLTMWYLLNVYMCEKVHVRACMQCWREFAKCRCTHFPSLFSVHVDTYDYCNSLLLEIPLAQIERLQRIQNKAARLITGTRQHDHITPVLRALIWVSVGHQIQFKVLVNVFKCMHGLSPDNLTELVHVQRRDKRLRQPDTFTLSEQVTIRVIGKRAFGISAPPLWK